MARYDSHLESAIFNASQHTQGFTTADGYNYLSTTTSSDGTVGNATGFNYDAGFGSPTGNYAWWLGETNGSGTETFTHRYTTQSGDPAYVTNVQIAFSDLSNSLASGTEKIYVYINGVKVDLANDPRITLINNADGDYTSTPDGGVTTIYGRSTNVFSGGALQSSEIGFITINDPGGISSISVEYVGSGGNGMLYDIGADPCAWYPPNGPCFADTVMIDTVDGPKAAGALKVGDQVITRDFGAQPVRWIGSHTVSGARMAPGSKLRPIRIREGALGDGIPCRDLLVSPQHRILVRSRIATRMFGSDEVLVAAKQLLILDGVDYADLEEVTYVHILFDDHQIVFSDGAETESFYTGPEALKSVGPEALEEIYEIFPELKDPDFEPTGARPLASGRMARKLAHRHAQNNKMLVT